MLIRIRFWREFLLLFYNGEIKIFKLLEKILKLIFFIYAFGIVQNLCVLYLDEADLSAKNIIHHIINSIYYILVYLC